MNIYLDSASTTKPKQEVIDAMMPYLTDKWYNPSSLYSKSVQIKDDIEKARKTVGDFINANSNEIFFTSSGSESNNWVIQGFISYCDRINKNPIIITSSIEHKSIIDCINEVSIHSYVEKYFLGVNNQGFINKKELESLLEEVSCDETNLILVSIQFANNEIGTVQEIKRISEIVHKYNAVFHTDAVQAFGHLPIDVKSLGIDMLTASGHKIGTPKGVAILYKKESIIINPLIYGSQMDGLRGGTENVPYIIGMAKAVELARVDSSMLYKIWMYRDYFSGRLKEEFDCTVNGSEISRLPNNINVTFKQNITGEALIYLLDMCGIYVSSGSACNSKSIKPSHVLKAIGLSDEDASKTIRITISEDITAEQINKFICELKKQITLLTND